MTYWDRLHNFWLKFLEWRTYAKQADDLNRLFQSKCGPHFPDIERLVANVSMIFVNSNEFFDIAKPWTHKVTTIGGIVEKEAKPLSTVTEIFEKKTRKHACFRKFVRFSRRLLMESCCSLSGL